jgi:hypothetical protein
MSLRSARSAAASGIPRVRQVGGELRYEVVQVVCNQCALSNSSTSAHLLL